MTSDLPVELWCHILEFLPKHYLRRMMCVSRTLFELAMDEIYREVRFIEDGPNMIQLFNQLKYPLVSQRVRHLYIRPAFFSRMDLISPIQKSFWRRLGGNKWKKYLYFSTQSSNKLSQPPKPLANIERDILDIARDTLVRIPQVEQLSIVLHDLCPPSTFPDFLSTIWTNLGPKLSRLSVDFTLEKLCFILRPDMAQHLSRLTELNVHIAVSRFKELAQEGVLETNLLPFITSLRGTLESLSLSSTEALGLSYFFRDLGYFPHLQKLDIRIVMTWQSFPADPTSLTSFVTLHKDNLQYFSMKPHQPFQPGHVDGTYKNWVTDELSRIKFSALKSLELGLHPCNTSPRPIVPHLSSTKLPKLVSVTLTDAPLLHGDIQTILEKVGDVIVWETLRLYVDLLTPPLIDTLAARLPYLTELDLTCERGGIDQDSPFLGTHQLTFGQEMLSRTFPTWHIRRLRIAVVSFQCGHPHANLVYMEYVTRCLPSAVSFLVEDPCVCQLHC